MVWETDCFNVEGGHTCKDRRRARTQMCITGNVQSFPYLPCGEQVVTAVQCTCSFQVLICNFYDYLCGLIRCLFNSWSPQLQSSLSVRVHLICRHSIAFLLPLWGVGGGDKKSRWCEIDDLNTSSINAAANVLFGDWWRMQVIHLSYCQLAFKILLRFSM